MREGMPDTLPLFYRDRFVSTDTLRLTEYKSVQERKPGFEGAPLPYSPRMDDAVALTLLACFFLTSIVLAHGKKFLAAQVSTFFLHRERTTIFATSTSTEVRYLVALVVQTAVLAGVAAFDYFHIVRPVLMERIPPLLLLGVYAGSCLLYVLLKWVVYMFLGWIFFDKNKTGIWLESYFALVYYFGFALFPYVLFLIYFELDLSKLVVFGAIIFFFTKILMLYKWIKLFSHQITDVFLLILYFCALEIVPCLLLYQSMVQINNLLLIKF
ncbi:DUF4271 domain-containing protein [Bacteroides pyogenes]|uniref:DUF4271 domain-containing protein n=2 Tax=Bacteroides pyogenes TaxID=310300 RepID=W4PL73_9BACE|nr:DUF4271 domain-containing protein [Bacteroides pyogenes]GAE16877.1 hypothetical protein JCM6292_3381 [Bacteroides pyogenes JCM 6292]MBR8705664.1 hypothetical protein [Bacteroides pyogenes]MBR8725179.1 hypothetical protein [Bacteroides pyogenes]MBR8738632.1 hypothetical protein [Bacteroides pyogenes]MBR8754374.1 hypothetical protein [Bacteroides pyogenes]